MKQSLFLLFSIFLFSSPIFSDEKQEEVWVRGKISFYCESLMEGRYEGVKEITEVKGQIVMKGDKIVPITIKVGNNVTTIDYEGPLYFKLYGPGAIEEGNVMAQCLLKEGMTEMFAMMLPVGLKRYMVNIVDVGDIASGYAKVVNFSEITVASIIAGKRVLTQANGNNIVSLDEIKKFQFSIRHAIAMENEDEEQWRIVHSKKVSARKTDRVLIFAYRKYGATGPWRSRMIRNP